MQMGIFSFLSVVFLTQFSHAYRDSPLPDFGPGYLTFYMDNDLFGDADKDYTNGVRVSWISSARDIGSIGSVQRALRPFTGDADSIMAFQKITGFKNPDAVQYNYGFSLTQLMFTPEDNLAIEQPLDQRRYAGWLALGFSLHTKDTETMNSVEFLLGVTGKDSLSEDTQNVIHDFREIPRFEGWDNQIPSEITFDFSFVQKRRLDFGKQTSFIRMDGIGEWGARLGTFRTNAHIGGMVRLGVNLPPDFSSPQLSETAYAHKYFENENSIPSWSLYTFIGVNGVATAYDATLDGPIFHSDFKTGNNRETFYGDLYAGLGFLLGNTELSYCHTWRTQEYEEQPNKNDFGTLSVRIAF